MGYSPGDPLTLEGTPEGDGSAAGPGFGLLAWGMAGDAAAERKECVLQRSHWSKHFHSTRKYVPIESDVKNLWDHMYLYHWREREREYFLGVMKFVLFDFVFF